MTEPKPTWWDKDRPQRFRFPEKQEPWDESMAPLDFLLHCPSCGQPVTVIAAADQHPDATLQTWTCPHCRQASSGEFPGEVLFANKGHQTPRL
jgi:hypothetical protein